MTTFKLTSENRFKVAVSIMLGFSFSLLFFRILYTGTAAYAFLVWNLILAVIPWLLLVNARKLLFFQHRILAFILTMVAVLFLPNAPYILTDLFHIRNIGSMPLWFDTMLIASCAATGLFFFYKSLRKLEAILLHFVPTWLRIASIVGIAFLSGFGIYLGRYERFNSWSIISDTEGLISAIAAPFLHPMQHTETWAMTLVYGFGLLLLYLVTMLLRPEPIRKKS